MSDNPRPFLNLTAGVAIPGAQALVTGALAGSLAGSLAILNHAPDPGGWALLGAAIIGGAAWLHGVSWWRSAIKPGELQPAQAFPAESTRVELAKPDGAYLWVDLLDLPIGKDTMTAAAVDLAAKGYQTSNLGGRGKALTRSQAEALRDYMVCHGLASWVRPDAHTAGWELSGAGRSLVRKFAALALPEAPPIPHQAAKLGAGWQSLNGMQTHTNTQRGWGE